MTTDNSITAGQVHRGTVSTTHGEHQDAPERTERPNYTGRDLQRAEIRGGEQTGRTFNSSGRASSADINSHTQGNPFTSIRHERTKNPISIHEATSESIVELPSGATLTLGSAIRGGLVQRNGDGYVVVGQSGGSPRQSHGQQQSPTDSLKVRGGDDPDPDPSAGEQEEQEEQHDDLKMESLGDDIERPMADLVERTSADSQIDAVKDVAETGKISEQTMGALG